MVSEVRALQLFCHGSDLDRHERELAKLFAKDPEGAQGSGYQNIVEGGREMARARIETCLSKSEDAFVRSLCGNSSPLTPNVISERLKEFMNFRDHVRQSLGDEHLIGNIAIHNMSLGNVNGEYHGPVVNFRIYRYPSETNPCKYDFDVCMDLRNGKILLGLTQNADGDHFYLPTSVTEANFSRVLEILEEKASVANEVDQLKRRMRERFGETAWYDFWRVGDELAKEFSVED